MSKDALIIMAKNPIKGKVKTRLSVNLGDDATLLLYKNLMSITRVNTQDLPIDKHIFYSNFIDLNDEWSSNKYNKHLQIQKQDLGIKMKSAFQELFKIGYKKYVIIGTDCPYITPDIINSAFYKLNDYDVVIGPAVDGGFYLLGINTIESLLFEQIIWSTNTVFEKLVNNLKNQNLTIAFLQQLEDIDDLNSYKRYLKSTEVHE